MAQGDVFTATTKIFPTPCIKFDGLNDYVGLASLNGLALSKYTISFFVNTNDKSGTETILYIHDRIFLGFTGGNFQGKLFSAGWRGCEFAATDIELKKWHHITVTYDGVDMKTYFDGVLKNTTFVGTYSLTLNNTGRLGSWNGGAGTWLNGYLKDFALYSTVLTAEEIKKISCKNQTISHDLEQLLTFNNTTSLGEDTSGNSRDGNPQGVITHPMMIPARVTANDKYYFIDLADGTNVMQVHIEEA